MTERETGITPADMVELFRINPLAKEQALRIATERLLTEAEKKIEELTPLSDEAKE